MSANNEETMRRFVDEAINRGHFSVLDEIIHPDYVFRSPGNELRGRGELRAFLSAYRNAFPDLKVAIEDLLHLIRHASRRAHGYHGDGQTGQGQRDDAESL